MSTRNLDKLMAPGSIVAIGASTRPGSVGAAVTRNLLAGGFKGHIHLVNIKGGVIEGRPVHKGLAELPQPATTQRIAGTSIVPSELCCPNCGHQVTFRPPVRSTRRAAGGRRLGGVTFRVGACRGCGKRWRLTSSPPQKRGWSEISAGSD